jgi:hypothetical protein
MATSGNGLKKEESWKPFYVGDPAWRDVFRLPPNALKVWLYHYSRENANDESWPSLATICKDCDISRNTAIGARAFLKECGWLIKVREITKEGDEFNVPVFRVRRGVLPEDLYRSPDTASNFGTAPPDQKLVRTPEFGATPNQNLVLPPDQKLVQELTPSLTNTIELTPTLLSFCSSADSQTEAKPQTHSVSVSVSPPRLQSKEEIRRMLQDEPDASLLTRKFIELGGHYIWKRKHPMDRDLCNKAFEHLLAMGEPEQHILSIIEYMAENAHYSTGAKTVTEVFPWDWFVKKFDQIATHMEADGEFLEKLRKRNEKKAAAMAAMGVRPADPTLDPDPLWETVDGSRKLSRKPRNAKERQSLISLKGKAKTRWEYIAQFLVQDSCPKCRGKNLNCTCVLKEELL